jgi:predicted ATPase
MRGASNAETEALLQQALQTARSQQAKSLELRAATDLARLWSNQGKRVEARELLSSIYASFREGFDTQDLKDANTLLGAVS